MQLQPPSGRTGDTRTVWPEHRKEQDRHGPQKSPTALSRHVPLPHRQESDWPGVLLRHSYPGVVKELRRASPLNQGPRLSRHRPRQRPSCLLSRFLGRFKLRLEHLAQISRNGTQQNSNIARPPLSWTAREMPMLPSTAWPGSSCKWTLKPVTNSTRRSP